MSDTSNLFSFKDREQEYRPMISENELPPPLTPNILAPFSSEHAKVCAQLHEQQVGIFGAAKFNQYRTVASMAGRLVVAAALGQKPSAFRFTIPEEKANLSRQIHIEWDAEYLQLPISLKTRPEILIQAAIHSCASKAGEVMAGFHHNASLVSDIYRGSVATVFLDYQYSQPMNTHMYRTMDYTNEVVSLNSSVFDELYVALCAWDEVPLPYLHSLLDKVTLQNSAHLIGALQ